MVGDIAPLLQFVHVSDIERYLMGLRRLTRIRYQGNRGSEEEAGVKVTLKEIVTLTEGLEF